VTGAGREELRASTAHRALPGAVDAMRASVREAQGAIGHFGRPRGYPIPPRGSGLLTTTVPVFWSLAAPLAGGPGRLASSLPRLRRRQPSVSGTVALARRSLHARRAILHDLDAALPGRLRRGRCACPPPPLASRAYRGLRPHCRPLRVCRTRLHFADRFRAGAGRRSGSGWRQGRVRWGRPLLSRPRGAVGSGPAAVESAAASVVALTCGVCVVGEFGWL